MLDCPPGEERAPAAPIGADPEWLIPDWIGAAAAGVLRVGAVVTLFVLAGLVLAVPFRVGCGGAGSSTAEVREARRLEIEQALGGAQVPTGGVRESR